MREVGSGAPEVVEVLCREGGQQGFAVGGLLAEGGPCMQVVGGPPFHNHTLRSCQAKVTLCEPPFPIPVAYSLRVGDLLEADGEWHHPASAPFPGR